jgi:hypothetical protein
MKTANRFVGQSMANELVTNPLLTNDALIDEVARTAAMNRNRRQQIETIRTDGHAPLADQSDQLKQCGH